MFIGKIRLRPKWGSVFPTSALLPPAKSVVFAGCAAQINATPTGS
jgi:hypothetical protein